MLEFGASSPITPKKGVVAVEPKTTEELLREEGVDVALRKGRRGGNARARGKY